MRIALIFLMTLTVLGCSDAPPVAPTSATPVPESKSSSATVWVMVVGESGACIANATVQVVAGQALGRTATQEADCDVWSYGGGITFQ
jgi:hypothetical protein